MDLYLKRLLARGPEIIKAEGVLVRELPLEELGLTALYIFFAGLWVVFSEDVWDWVHGGPVQSTASQTLRGINFVFTSGIVVYLVLRRTFRARRAALEASRLSQERFESAALASTDAIWDLNLDTKVLWWSEGIQKLFGYSLEEVSSKFEWWHQRVHPDDRERVVDSILKIVQTGGRTWNGEYRFRRRDGRYAFVSDRGHIIPDAAGKPTRLVGGLTDISERRLAQQALETSRQQLRALTARLQSGREEERTKVAREIHDDLGQVLTALKLNLDWMERRVGELKEDGRLNLFLERIVESQEVVEGAIESVQRIATELRPALLDNVGLAEALREESRRFQERSGTTCNVQLPSIPLKLPAEASTCIFRVFQEALSNVARHAKATTVSVSFESSGDQVILNMEDDGLGIASEALTDPRSLGLLGMAERASALGGQVAIGPATPRGTRVTLRLPFRADSNPPAPAAAI
jgi:two-component system sensor histidine kinase UhpB